MCVFGLFHFPILFTFFFGGWFPTVGFNTMKFNELEDRPLLLRARIIFIYIHTCVLRFVHDGYEFKTPMTQLARGSQRDSAQQTTVVVRFSYSSTLVGTIGC